MVKTVSDIYQAKYLAKKRKKIFLCLFLWLVLFLAISAGLVYLLFFSKLFYVKEVSIANQSFIPNQEIRQAIDELLAQKRFFVSGFSNLIFVESGKIQSLIVNNFPQAENVTVEKEYPHTVKVSLDGKTALGVWCFGAGDQDKCFYFDKNGVAFETSADSDGPLLLRIEDEKGRFEKLGQAVAGKELLAFVLSIRPELEKVKIDIKKITVPADEDFRVDTQTSEGWEIYFSARDDLKSQVNSLDVFLSQKISPEKRSQLQYIDVRIPNRVYYK
ncbi:MAG: hypothetical protein HYT63_00865 [Candidatus Yanofskybacteria bacterium]|nr:hypothetical protein [Candidatus Yanofskybacteria bacterium]